MCGIIGYMPVVEPDDNVAEAFKRLFYESTIRGLHAFGIAQPDVLIKGFSPDDLEFDPREPAIAHARYCTSGDWKKHTNNQPLKLGSYYLAFNGVIHMGTKEEMEAEFNLKLASENDGEVFLRYLQSGVSPDQFLLHMKGSFAGCWLYKDVLYAGRNARRPLWKCYEHGSVWYASTEDIFLRAGFHDPFELPVGVQRA